MGTTTLSTPGRSAGHRSPVRGWLAVGAVTLAIFALMTSELLPVGLLTPIGHDLGISDGTSGLMVTVPGIVAAFSAPLITVFAGHVDRRLVLCVLVGLMGAANLAVSLSDHIVAALAARFLVGASVGGFWAIAGGIALRLVPERHVGRALVVIFAGVESATVLGVPAGTYLGELVGWRAAFAAVGLLGLGTLVCMALLLPAMPATRTITLGSLPSLFRANGAVRIGVLLTFLIITGHFLAYTYLRPVLEDTRGIDGRAVSTLLLVFGVAGIAGNVIAGVAAARRVRATVLTIGMVLTAAMVSVMFAGDGVPGAVFSVVVWGLAYGSVPVTLQTWILKAAPEAAEAASSLYVLMFNLSIALGAAFGGLVVDHLGTLSILWLGGALTAAASTVVVCARSTTLASGFSTAADG
ncbi:MFS transporter [Phytoactinopolyspora halotolerans]|uniref:MFS transporter n=1 Tax=Phytoactinopolyspora halotolerans TaxID=1981512 RepID=A0A6L9S9R0_9ACTN|nr:MFS transporter [Phytoactinopolyspora halotolerans]NEE02115.1 MFS transporter [Phytoactinopolyspora halotolerans]